MITIYPTRGVVTMHAAQPRASHVAVNADRILGVGDLAALKALGPHAVDERFADKVLMPGFVEAHSHITEGTYWRYPYVGYFDRTDPRGRLWPGCRSVASVLDRLREFEVMQVGTSPLSAWGLDSIHYADRPPARAELDQVSTTRAVGVLHASGHTLSVNSRALDLAGMLRTGIDHPGVPLDADGLPPGELRGPDVMTIAGGHVGFDRNRLACDEEGLRAFAKICVRAGVTTATDMATLLPDEAVDLMLRVTGEASFPVRIACARRLQGIAPAALAEQVFALRERSTDRLRLGMIKVVVDGSIQGFTARIAPPGYHNGAPNGLWYVAPEALTATFAAALERGLQVHTHANGDEAIALVLQCFEQAAGRNAAGDHRFTVQHAQLATVDHFAKMRALGLCVNLFANHTYHWGEEHLASTVGPERAARMNGCASAIAQRVRFAIHSDAPVTPLRPLFTAWCAANRLTSRGRLLGAEQRISVPDALHAITLGAAATLKLDDEIGSIAPGKRADFAVLEDDPLACDAASLRDVRVWGTVQGGRVFPAASQS